MVEAGAQREASAYVWNVRAVIDAHRGDWAAPRRPTRAALERLGEVGDFNLEAEVWQMRSAIYICSGAFGSAEGAWSRHRELAERKGNPQNLCWSLLDEAETRVGRDEVDAAAVALDAGARRSRPPPNDGSSTIEKHYATALVRAAQGRWDEAMQAADAVVDDHRAPAAVGLPLRRLLRRARCESTSMRSRRRPLRPRRDAAPGASAAASSCAALARQFGSVAPRRWLLQGLLEWERGRPASARATALAAAEEVAARDGHALRARPRAATRSPATATPAPAGARPCSPTRAATFEQLGALQMLRRVREAQSDRSRGGRSG